MRQPAPITDVLAAIVAELATRARAQGQMTAATDLHELAKRIDPAYAALMTTQDAARYLGLSVRALQDRADIPRADIAAPGSERPMWRYRRSDLDAFIESRLVNPAPRIVGKESAA